MSDVSWRNIWKSHWVVLLAVIILAIAIGVDIWLAIDDVEGNTWSEMLRIAGYLTPVVPWACGVVTGHWFHPRKDDADPVIASPGNMALLIWLSWVVFLIGLALVNGAGVAVPLWIPLLAGMVAGALLWPV